VGHRSAVASVAVAWEWEAAAFEVVAAWEEGADTEEEAGDIANTSPLKPRGGQSDLSFCRNVALPLASS
jgi:hypothetical protein